MVMRQHHSRRTYNTQRMLEPLWLPIRRLSSRPKKNGNLGFSQTSSTWQTGIDQSYRFSDCLLVFAHELQSCLEFNSALQEPDCVTDIILKFDYTKLDVTAPTSGPWGSAKYKPGDCFWEGGEEEREERCDGAWAPKF